MDEGNFYNFYSITVGNNINEPTAFTNLINQEVLNKSSRLKYMILSPYCFYYIKPLWSDSGCFTFKNENQDLLSRAGLMGKLLDPFDFEIIISHALAPQKSFLVTYGSFKDNHTQFISDKTTQAFLFHLVSHIETAKSLLAIRQELNKPF